MSTQPGATRSPSASISRRAAPARPPACAMRPASMARSPVRAGAPVPSTRVPPRMTRSCIGLPPDSRINEQEGQMLRTVPGPPYHSRPRSGVVIGRHTSYDAAPKRGEDMSDADETPERDLDRKDRLVQTRVPRGLESTLKREARRRRLTVSHLIRNILEDALQLVDDVVANV